ncbi:MAG: Holliday junction branch migration protein RuvA [Bdellovibrionales bacterium]
MIAFLKGTLFETTADTLVIETGGVGYEVHCSQNTLTDLIGSASVQVFVHTHVREDQITLFGFSTRMEKELFISLNKVNGVGPKMAQKVLSGASPTHLMEMIEQEDAAGLSRLPKVGKKTAEQIILTLKGKLHLDFELAQPSSQRKDIVSALTNLGFKLNDVEKVVNQFPTDLTMEEGLKRGLAALTQL